LADVTENVQSEGDEHWCSGCFNWWSGLSTDEKVVYIEDDEFIMPVEDFDVDAYTKTRRTCQGGCVTILEAGWDTEIIDVVNGDPIWTCDECDSSYPTEERAINCC